MVSFVVVISMDIYSLREKEMKLQDSYNVFISYGDGFVCCYDFYGYIFPTGKRDEITGFFQCIHPLRGWFSLLL